MQSQSDGDLLNDIPMEQNEEHEAEERVAPSALLKGAMFLEGCVANRTGLVWKHAAEHEGSSVKLLQKRASAAAEACVAQQDAGWRSVIHYVLRVAPDLVPLLFVERQAYDATPSRLRIPNQDGCQEERKVKLFMIETEVAILLAKRGNRGNDEAGNYLLLRVPFSHTPRVAAKGDAFCTKEVLSSTVPAHGALAEGCPNIFRISESDEDGSNLKAERLLAHSRSKKWQEGLLHCLCSAHKCHAACQKTWEDSDIISGFVHAYKALEDVGTLNAVREFMLKEIPKRLHIVRGSDCPLEGQSFRENMLKIFTPSKSRPRLRARVTEVCRLLNGDWRRSKILIHHCKLGCCSSPESTVQQLQSILVKTLLGLRRGIFSRDNWTEWPHQMLFFAWASFLHGFMLDAFLAVLKGQEVIPEEHDAANLEAAEALVEQRLAAARAPPLPDAMAVARQEKSKALRIAVAFLPSPWFRDFFILRVALEPEVQLMSYLVDSVSIKKETAEMQSHLHQGQRQYNICKLLSLKPMQDAIQLGVANICDEKSWSPFAETEEFRSEIWRVASRPMAVLWQLLCTRFSTYPWKLFQLLSNRSEDCATALLNERNCLKDEWSRAFLARYNTSEKLVGEECFQILSTVAVMLQTSTFSTERLHSVNLRQCKTRAHVKRMSAETVALKHGAVATLPWLHRHVLKKLPLEGSKKAKRGRPKIEREAEGSAKKRRTGAGGAWRAFVHVRCAGQNFSQASLLEWSAEYRQLTPEQKAYFIELGKQGPWLA